MAELPAGRAQPKLILSLEMGINVNTTEGRRLTPATISCSAALTHSVFIRRCLGIARRILNRHRVRFDCQRSTNSECSAGTQLLEEVASQIKTALGGLRWAQLGIYGWGIHAKRQPIRPRLCWENERVNIRPTRLPP